MGTDNLERLDNWKNYEMILKNYHILVFPRKESDGGKLKNHPSVSIVNTPLIEVSGTFIRQCIAEGKDVRFFMPSAVWDYIDEMNFYKR